MDPQAVFRQIRALKLTQEELAQKQFVVKSKGINVTVTGDVKIASIMMPGLSPLQTKALQQTINTALKKAHTAIRTSVAKIGE